MVSGGVHNALRQGRRKESLAVLLHLYLSEKKQEGFFLTPDSTPSENQDLMLNKTSS